jgi:hypothetical protein
MPVPAKVKTWDNTDAIGVSTNRRSAYVSVAQVTKDLLYWIKEGIKATTGVSVKGSGISGAAAMDGVDRWTSAAVIPTVVVSTTSANTGWIVFDTGAAMGNVEIALSYIGGAAQGGRLAFAPANDYALAGTVTFHPTCTNEQVILAGDLNPATASGDRLLSFMSATDGSGFFWMVARSSVMAHVVIAQKVASQVNAPATNTPGFFGWAFTVSPVVGTIVGGAPLGVGRVNGVNATTLGSTELVSNAAAPLSLVAASDLQGAGTGYLLYPIGLWSLTIGARGKIGVWYDFYLGLSSAGDGDYYSDDGGVTKPWINVGDVVLPWDNSTWIGA